MLNGGPALSDFDVPLSDENQLSEVDESTLLSDDDDDDDVDFSSFGGGFRLRPPVGGHATSSP